MRPWVLGVLTFALIGGSGYLTMDYDPGLRVGSVSVMNGGPGTVKHRPGTKKSIEKKEQEPVGLVLPKQAGRDDLPEPGIPGALAAGQGLSARIAAIQSLPNQLGGDKLPEPRIPTADELAAADRKCRDRMREFGIVIPSGPCTDVGDVVDNLATGKYHFNKPDSVMLGEPFRLRLFMQTAEVQPINFDGLPGTVVVRPGKLAQSVEATLSGDDFEITPAGPQARTATRSELVEWDWRLKPTSTGTKTLTIEVAANIQIGSDKHRVQIQTLHESIVIQVTMFQRLKAYVADASGMAAATVAVVTPLAVLIGFVPKVRKFFKDMLASFRRRRARRT